MAALKFTPGYLAVWSIASGCGSFEVCEATGDAYDAESGVGLGFLERLVAVVVPGIGLELAKDESSP